MKTHRLIALFLCLAAIISATACAKKTGGSDKTESGGENNAGETETERIENDLPDKNWGGEEIMILGCVNETYPQFTNFEITAEQINGEPVNDAIFNRNAEISAKYGIEIRGNLVDDPLSVLIKTVGAGDDSFDLTFLRYSNFTSAASGGYLTDLYKLPYLDFEKPWWYLEVNGALSIGGRLYATSSAFNLQEKGRIGFFCFNKDMFGEYRLENPYQLVRDGKWTLDVMTAMCKKSASDIDGDGVMGDLDRWGLGLGGYGAFYGFIITQGNSITAKDENDIPTLAMNTEHIINSIDKTLKLCNDTAISFYCPQFQNKVDFDFWLSGIKIFAERGNALFTQADANTLTYFSASAINDYGVLPWPKYDEAQDKYYACPDSYCTLIAVPRTNIGLEATGFALEALAAANYYGGLPAYIEVSAKTKHTYDKESAEMMDIAYSNVRYDLGVAYNWGGLLDIIAVDIPTKGKNNFASLYASRESAALKQINDTVEIYGGLE